MGEQSNRNAIIGQANAFRIWREGKSVDWCCTISELAEATGLTYACVRTHVRERGWPVEDDALGQSWLDNFHAVDHEVSDHRHRGARA